MDESLAVCSAVSLEVHKWPRDSGNWEAVEGIPPEWAVRSLEVVPLLEPSRVAYLSQPMRLARYNLDLRIQEDSVTFPSKVAILDVCREQNLVVAAHHYYTAAFVVNMTSMKIIVRFEKTVSNVEYGWVWFGKNCESIIALNDVGLLEEWGLQALLADDKTPRKTIRMWEDIMPEPMMATVQAASLHPVLRDQVAMLAFDIEGYPTVLVWNWMQNQVKVLPMVCPGSDSQYANSVRFMPDGSVIATFPQFRCGGRFPLTEVYLPPDYTEKRQWISPYFGEVRGISASEDGTKVAMFHDSGLRNNIVFSRMIAIWEWSTDEGFRRLLGRVDWPNDLSMWAKNVVLIPNSTRVVSVHTIPMDTASDTFELYQAHTWMPELEAPRVTSAGALSANLRFKASNWYSNVSCNAIALRLPELTTESVNGQVKFTYCQSNDWQQVEVLNLYPRTTYNLSCFFTFLENQTDARGWVSMPDPDFKDKPMLRRASCEVLSKTFVFDTARLYCERGKYAVGKDCVACNPSMTTMEEGAESIKSCICMKDYGLNDKGACEDCVSLGLNCSNVELHRQLTLVSSAVGHARLAADTDKAHACLDLNDGLLRQRCVGNTYSQQCGPDFTGTLCHSCGPKARHVKNGDCQPCQGNDTLTLALAIVFLCFFILLARWMQRHAAQYRKRLQLRAIGGRPFLQLAFTQLAQQTSILLTFVQLAGGCVVAATRGNKNSLVLPNWAKFADNLQVTPQGLRDAFRLDCLLGVETAMSILSLMRPVLLPALLAVLWIFCKLYRRTDLAIKVSLTLTTLLFVGGVSTSAALVVESCILVDGADQSLEEHAFSKVFPFKKCNSSFVWWSTALGVASLVFHGIFVPLGLIALLRHYERYARIHVQGKTLSVTASKLGRQMTLICNASAVGQASRNGTEAINEEADARILAAAYMGSFHVACGVNKGTLSRLPAGELKLELDDMEEGAQPGSGVELSQDIVATLRNHVALTVASRSDEVLRGAESLFFKYAGGRAVLAEPITKAMIVLLSSLAESNGSAASVVAIMMALVLLFVKPYFSPAMNYAAATSYMSISVMLMLASLTSGPSVDSIFIKLVPYLMIPPSLAPFVAVIIMARKPDNAFNLSLRVHGKLCLLSSRQLEPPGIGIPLQLVRTSTAEVKSVHRMLANAARKSRATVASLPKMEFFGKETPDVECAELLEGRPEAPPPMRGLLILVGNRFGGAWPRRRIIVQLANAQLMWWRPSGRLQEDCGEEPITRQAKGTIDFSTATVTIEAVGNESFRIYATGTQRYTLHRRFDASSSTHKRQAWLHAMRLHALHGQRLRQARGQGPGELGPFLAERKTLELAHRGLTLGHLIEFYQRLGTDVMRHFDPDKSTTNDVVRQAIIPLSAGGRSALATVFSQGSPKRPRKMVTHNWANRFRCLVGAVVADALDFPTYEQAIQLLHPSKIETLKNYIQELGRWEYTYWICAFCVNQHSGICGGFGGGTAGVPQLDSTGVEMQPCDCGLAKHFAGDACEMNKFDDMMGWLGKRDLEFAQVVALDPDFQLFKRAWCQAELVEANNLKLSQHLKYLSRARMQEHIEELRLVDIRDCEASRPEDKEGILAKVQDVEAFNNSLRELVFDRRSGLIASWERDAVVAEEWLSLAIGGIGLAGLEMLE